MRRVKTQVIEGVQWRCEDTVPFPVVVMERRDYRLMCAVVRAADSFWLVWGDKKISSAAVVRLGAAVARFNAKPRSKP